MFTYLLLINGIKINQILKGRVTNTTSGFQSNCSTCICQCIKFGLSLSSLFCYVNCYTNNDTCQVIISASKSNLGIVIDQTSIIYFVNYSTYTTTTIKPSTTSTNYGSLLIANIVTNSSSTRTSSISVTYATTMTTTITP
ncbi:unnamed protein product [Rotaria sp. Silwood1]|nr:unnamed protein product [Rotaria sp. Silwood1]CAF0936082.1 unnamed protein product [Rotaria sp. Silwood1]CAF1025339.1 unnamed protein product [Rotaria sp. Silwood1]CAF3343176.1 unnamed protein product [Rotaria sp. Silwood1]CAF3429364.1 unnamed protein product [Rotaria sp. Silwood1]